MINLKLKKFKIKKFRLKDHMLEAKVVKVL
jgi:hypothetical protein